MRALSVFTPQVCTSPAADRLDVGPRHLVICPMTAPAHSQGQPYTS